MMWNYTGNERPNFAIEPAVIINYQRQDALVVIAGGERLTANKDTLPFDF